MNAPDIIILVFILLAVAGLGIYAYEHYKIQPTQNLGVKNQVNNLTCPTGTVMLSDGCHTVIPIQTGSYGSPAGCVLGFYPSGNQCISNQVTAMPQK